MYVWQMNDGYWHISHMTNSREAKPAFGSAAFALYEKAYWNEREAKAAMSEIRRLIAA